jgi:hypothetical protein
MPVGDPFDAGDHASGKFGDVEANVRADLAAIESAHPFAETLGSVSRRLARSLDEDRNDVKAPLAGTARELRMTLTEIARFGTGEGDDFESEISAPTPDTSPVRDTPDTR